MQNMRRGFDEKGKKLFIGGLHMKTTEESLRNFYGQWGEIVDCVVMKDNATGRSRGFGFVTYKDMESIDLAQNNRPHEIDGITVDSKRAMPKEDTSPEFHVTVNRLFLGRLKKDVTNEDLYEYFGKYGTITDAVVIKNPNGESRGFGFVTFEDTDCVDKIIVSRPHKMNGQNIEVKKAQPKDGDQKSSGSGGRGGASRGRGGGQQEVRGGRGGRGGGGGGGRGRGNGFGMGGDFGGQNSRFPPGPPMNDNWGYGGYPGAEGYGGYGMGGAGDNGMPGSVPGGYGMPNDDYGSQMAPPYGSNSFNSRYDSMAGGPPAGGPGGFGDNSFFSGPTGGAGPYDNGRYGEPEAQAPYAMGSYGAPNAGPPPGRMGGPGPIRGGQKFSGRMGGASNTNPYGTYPY